MGSSFLKRQAERPVGVPRRPERDDLRVPDGAACRQCALHSPVASRSAQAHYLGFLYAAPAAGAFIATRLLRPSEGRSSAGTGDRAVDRRCGAPRSSCSVSRHRALALARMLAIAGAACDMVERDLPDHAIMQAAVEDRYQGRLGGIGMAVWADRALDSATSSPAWSRRSPRADLDRFRRPHHDRRDRRAARGSRLGSGGYDARHRRRRRFAPGRRSAL